MKKTMVVMMSLLFAAQVNASSLTGNSSSAADSAASSSAANMGNAGVASVSLTSKSSDDQKIRNVPSLGGNGFYGSYSTDNCMVSAGTTAVIAGFGGSVVAPVRDDWCSYLRTYERLQQGAATAQAIGEAQMARKLRQSSYDVICLTSDEVREIMVYQGICTNYEMVAQVQKQLQEEARLVALQRQMAQRQLIETMASAQPATLNSSFEVATIEQPVIRMRITADGVQMIN